MTLSSSRPTIRIRRLNAKPHQPGTMSGSLSHDDGFYQLKGRSWLWEFVSLADSVT